MQNSTATIGPSTCFPTIGNYWGDTGLSPGNASLVSASRTAKGHTLNTNLTWFTNDINGGNGYGDFATGSAASLEMLGYIQNVRS